MNANVDAIVNVNVNVNANVNIYVYVNVNVGVKTNVNANVNVNVNVNRELKVEIANWWYNDQLIILNWELVFLGFGKSPIPNPKNTNTQLKITNR